MYEMQPRMALYQKSHAHIPLFRTVVVSKRLFHSWKLYLELHEQSMKSMVYISENKRKDRSQAHASWMLVGEVI
jgi:hypothetical protein